jgi:toxin secretion/phage lysis holin
VLGVLCVLTGILGAVKQEQVFVWFEANTGIGVLLAFMWADTVTGIMVAFVSKVINSDASFKGITKKLCVLISLLMCSLLEVAYLKLQGSPSPIPIYRIATLGYIAWEFGSVMENMGKLGAPINPSIMESLSQIKALGRKPAEVTIVDTVSITATNGPGDPARRVTDRAEIPEPPSETP